MDEYLKCLKLAFIKNLINKRQLKTLKGQALSGNLEGAKKGLLKVIRRKSHEAS